MANDAPIGLVPLAGDAADAVIPARLHALATNVRWYMENCSFFDLRDAANPERAGAYELWYYGALVELPEEEIPGEEEAGAWDDGEEETEWQITDSDWPALLVARDPKTGCEVVLHDNACHGVDALFFGAARPGPDDRPLVRLDMPLTELTLQFLYDEQVAPLRSLLAEHENGLLQTKDGSTRSWADIISDAYTHVSVMPNYSEQDWVVYGQSTSVMFRHWAEENEANEAKGKAPGK